MSAWVKVWLPSSNPWRWRLCRIPGCRTAALPSTKKVAGARSRRSSRAILGVQLGSGPSSKVSATRRPGGGCRETSFPSEAVKRGRDPTSGDLARPSGVLLDPTP